MTGQRTSTADTIRSMARRRSPATVAERDGGMKVDQVKRLK